ncbi:TPA: NAD-dependent protein deacylase [Candidatus Poribacteria bacterium]|nr:NAD-dependent protein deacylase [Candidatus Poribacteria bacterium]HEX30898.1 NAD-dependent protein deacylase [Candidatus Poribacteria bacterium]
MVREYAEEMLRELRVAGSAVVLTGAGVSTASGIPDFRGPGGIYSKVSPEVFDIDSFMSHPERYYRIEREILREALNAKPNVTHFLIAKLERMGLIEAVITQNIDGLHRKAGSSKVIELHGNISTGSCLRCGRRFRREEIDRMLRAVDVPRCECGGVIKPDVVFFGEMLPPQALNEGMRLAAESDLMVVMGSSLVVHPAATLPSITVRNGGKLIIVNRGETALDYLAYRKYDVDLVGFSREALRLLEGYDT